MTEKLEKLIALAVSDGEVTDRELEILKKKASEEGVDEDELEMLLETRLWERKQVMKEEIKNSIIPPPLIEKPKSNKEGDITKCPSCGSSVQSFYTNCSDCGHEFRNIKSSTTINRLYEELQKIEEIERSRKRSWIEKIDGPVGLQRSVVTRQISAISAFPVPNTKEDLLEFLSVASSEANKKAPGFIGFGQHPDTLLKKAWHSKCEQIIMKARLSTKNDPKTLQDIEYYAKQLKIK